MRPNLSLEPTPAAAAVVWPLRAIVVIIPPRPAAGCLRRRLRFNVAFPMSHDDCIYTETDEDDVSSGG
jgi:hypothetical protein